MATGNKLRVSVKVGFNIRRNLFTSICMKCKETHFGFETVSEDEKSKKVYHVFENVASNYDLMNDTMSFGVHRLWKDRFVDKLNPSTKTRLLDVAGGTGDIAFRFLKHVNYKRRHFGEAKEDAENENAHVTVVDINKAMLEVGQKRAAEQKITEGISWLQGDAEQLPLENSTFDAYTIAFGIRNCVHVEKVINEAYRTLKPGGRFLCLEFSKVSLPLLSSAYDWYSFQIIPVMGHVIAGDWNSYQYLVESIRKFPDQEEFASMISAAGFKNVTYENMTCGVVAIHSGFKI